MRIHSIALAAALACLGVAQHTSPTIIKETREPIKPAFKRAAISVKSMVLRNTRPMINFQYQEHEQEAAENPAIPLTMGFPTETNTLPLGGIESLHRGTPGKFWNGIGATGWTPADPTVAAGPSHIGATVNETIAFYNKAGTAVYSNSLQNFMIRPSGNSVFDPRILWDRLAQRWIVIADESSNPNAYIDFAVSKTSDPLGGWWVYTFDVHQTVSGQNFWMDYPGFGYNKDCYLVSGNMFGFSSGFNGVQFLMIPKSQAINGLGVTALHFTDTAGASAQCADVGDASLDRAYACSIFNTSAMRVYAFSNIASAPVMNMTTVAIPTFTAPNVNVPSIPGTLSYIDQRVFEVSYRNGRLVMSHNASSGSGLATRPRWYEIATNNYPTSAPTLVQSGELLGPSPYTYSMSGIHKNDYGDISMIFTRSSSSVAGDAMRAGRFSADAAGTMGTPVLLANSVANSYGGTGTNRWGDYFGVAVDPTDGATFWGVAMVANGGGGWQTVINSWTVTSPANLTNLTFSPSSAPGGDFTTGTVTLSGPAPTGGYVVSLTVTGTTNGLTAVLSTTNVTVPAGAASATFKLSSMPVNRPGTITIQASLRGVTRSATMTYTKRIPIKN